MIGKTLVLLVSLLVSGISTGMAIAEDEVYLSSKEAIAIQKKAGEIRGTLETLNKERTDVYLSKEEAKAILEEVARLQDLVAPISLRLEKSVAWEPKYLGYKKGCGCHISQMRSWKETVHSKVFELLKPDVKVEEKRKVGLDPAKDYTQDKWCLPCHTTGYLEKSGYSIRIADKVKAEYLRGVTCEMCHGPSEFYRRDHRKAGDRFNKKGETAPRVRLVKLGQVFDYDKACARCHLNYERSPWTEAKRPYTPFTPKVGPEYRFNFGEFVKRIGKGNAMHEHFELKGVYEGEPIPKVREILKKDAKKVVKIKSKKDESKKYEGKITQSEDF